MAQITSVTSEALQAQIRNLLPSQQGFGEDLQATNVITPIIDLTPAALQTQTPSYMQQALAFGSQTSFNVSATTTVLANTPGFWRLLFSIQVSGTGTGIFSLSNGLSTKEILRFGGATGAYQQESYDFTVFLAAGESISANMSGSISTKGSYRQVADVNGNLVYPSGYTPQ